MNSDQKLSSELVNTQNIYQSNDDFLLLDQNQKKFLQDIDYSKPENFVKFGSAEEYYRSCIQYINTTYPYDGSLSDKLQWENNLNPFEYYIFRKEFPSKVGHIFLDDLAYINVMPNLSEEVTPNISKPLDPSAYETYLDFNNGVTFESWIKIPTGTLSASILSINGYQATDENDPSTIQYRQLLVFKYEDGLFYLTNEAENPKIEIPDPDSKIKINEWHHYAFSMSGNELKFYVDGDLFYADNVESVAGHYSYIYAPIGLIWLPIRRFMIDSSVYQARSIYTLGGKGKLYLDDTRLWNEVRTPEQIKLFWFTNVDGN
jgi:hypothetical protein